MITGESPKNQGLSRKSILKEIDDSVKHLGIDCIDLYIIDGWDYNTGIEETMCIYMM
jgi:aryl-alcohol dehydrogenase-like predicted oxidoreductase